MWLRSEAFQQRSRQPRLADACLARQQHDLAFAGLCLRPAPQQQFEFFFPSDKLSQPARVDSLEAAFRRTGRSAAQARTGPAMPFRSFAPRSSSSNRLPTSFRVLSAIDNAVRLRNALQARRKVRRLAYDCLLLRSARPDQIADDH